MAPIILLVLASLAVPVPERAASVPAVERNVQTPDPANVEQGRQLFEKNKCLLCHKLDGKGGTLSVPLDGVADRQDAKALEDILRNPATALKDSTAKVKMPKFPLTDEEVGALVAYLRTLKAS